MTSSGSRPRQLAFDFALPPRLGAGELIVGAANAGAVDHLERWPDWPARVVLLVGPPASGKSHLAALWAEASDAVRLAAGDLPGLDPLAAVAGGAVVVEDLGPGVDERALFHLVNAVLARPGHLLLTAETAPATWGLGLPDLVSRLRAATPLTLAEPDDDLLEAVIAKHFSDRQLAVDPSLPAFLARRMERSYAAARALVEALDREALASRAPVTRAVATRLLAAGPSREPLLPGFAAPDLDDDDFDPDLGDAFDAAGAPRDAAAGGADAVLFDVVEKKPSQ
jgi:chromosomal replication initiation ATPase DnaA